jgi:hypothetical protein
MLHPMYISCPAFQDVFFIIIIIIVMVIFVSYAQSCLNYKYVLIFNFIKFVVNVLTIIELLILLIWL